MLNWPQIIVSAAISFGGGYFAHVLAIRREAASRRKAFQGTIKSQLQKFEAIDLDKLREGVVFQIYKASVSEISDACAKILGDIPIQQKLKFDTACRQYCGMKQEDVEPYDIIPPWCSPSTPIRNYERGRERIVELLKQMIAYAV